MRKRLVILCITFLFESMGAWQKENSDQQPNQTLTSNESMLHNSRQRLREEDSDRSIRSAVNQHLMNVAMAAGQPMGWFAWRPNINAERPVPVPPPAEVKRSLPIEQPPPPPISGADGDKQVVSAPLQRQARDSENSANRVGKLKAELQKLLQLLYQAEATVQMEVSEVARSQQIASEAELLLEEAANRVRMLSSDLQAAQENAATCAMRAHTAQLQLASHDQLMFTARQRVDALSAQMVAVQAELASAQQSYTLNESTQHLEQQGRMSMVYQFQPSALGAPGPPAVVPETAGGSVAMFRPPSGMAGPMVAASAENGYEAAFKPPADSLLLQQQPAKRR